MNVPLNTYRIQFNKKFSFRDLKNIIPYLKDLGIDCIYTSPVFMSVPGSNHGYDQTDAHQINPEIGTLAELRILKNELKQNNIKWIQDIVPNHMAFHKDNHWLMDVLEKGKESEFRNFFDINWQHPYCKGKLMAPVLGETPEEAIKDGKITLKLTDQGICINYYEHSFPASINSYKFILESANYLGKKVLSIMNRDDDIQENLNTFSENKSLLKEFLDLQNFQLVYWQDTNNKINYRRFFTINSLICLKIEEESVFQYFHKFIFQLIKEEIFDGLRIDHIDGLLDPDTYLERLRKAVGKETYITVEKILGPNESLSSGWPVQGTTGYDFLANANRLLTDNNHYNELENIYRKYTNANKNYMHLVTKNKFDFLNKYMQGDLQYLFTVLKEILPDADLTSLSAMLAAIPVYRLYPKIGGLPQSDKNILIKSAGCAKAIKKIDNKQLGALLKLMIDGRGDQWLYFIQRFQQLSVPLSAKGIEDTTFYQHNLLISHNEVGDNPEFASYSKEDFTNYFNERNKLFKLSFNATSTHDTKRGEDARMRINVISEVPNVWELFLKKMNELNNNFSNNFIPDKNDMYFIYQSILGSWPSENISIDEYKNRLINYIIKALREGKINSDWARPNEQYENGIKQFINSLLISDEFLKKKSDLQKCCSSYGSLNSLSQLVLKCTLPGVADFYQGNELWDFSFVDPDNRRPVNYFERKQMLKQMKNLRYDQLKEIFIKNNNAPEVKFYFTYKLLNLRQLNKELFLSGDFKIVTAKGIYNENIYSFKRNHQQQEIIVACSRLLSKVYNTMELMKNLWSDTEIVTESEGEYIDAFSSETVFINNRIPLNKLFTHFPVSVLIKK